VGLQAAGNIEGLSSYEGDAIPPWNVLKNAHTFGFGILTVKSDRELLWQYYESETLRLLDEVTISRTSPSPMR
jgi:hypothetical protein